MESNDIQNNVFKNQQEKSMSWKTYFTLNKNKYNNYVIYENIPFSNDIYDTIATFNLPQEWFIWDNEIQDYIAPNVKYFIMLNELFIPKGTTEINFDIGFPTVETMPERIIAYTNNIYDNSDTTYSSKSIFGSGILKLQQFDIPSNTYAFSVICHVAGRDNFRPNILIKTDDRYNGELIRFNSQELGSYIKNSYYSKNINIEKNAKQIFIEILQDAPKNTLINATVTFYIRKYNPPEFPNGENSLTGLCNILCLKEN